VFNKFNFLQNDIHHRVDMERNDEGKHYRQLRNLFKKIIFRSLR